MKVIKQSLMSVLRQMEANIARSDRTKWKFIDGRKDARHINYDGYVRPNVYSR